jgi:hypothetical protein
MKRFEHAVDAATGDFHAAIHKLIMDRFSFIRCRFNQRYASYVQAYSKRTEALVPDTEIIRVYIMEILAFRENSEKLKKEKTEVEALAKESADKPGEFLAAVIRKLTIVELHRLAENMTGEDFTYKG